MSPEFKATSAKPYKGRTVDFDEGEYVFREGDLGTEMFIIHEGKIEIVQEAKGKSRTLATLEKGDFFGEMSILEELPRNASARAATHSKLIQINGATFDGMLRRNPEIGVRIMRKLSRRVRETDELLNEVLEDRPELPAEGQVKEPAQDEAAGPCRLEHLESGVKFLLSSDRSCTLGRRDPVTGISPDVDLTSVDEDRSSSRRHAKIYREGETYFVVEDIGATNGTYVNSKRIQAGVPAEIRSGDAVRFGLVELTFFAE